MKDKVEYYDITAEDKVFPGEYILHKPTQAVVLCGVFSRERDEIKALKNGRLFEDKISAFQKINTPRKKDFARSGGCGGCKGR